MIMKNGVNGLFYGCTRYDEYNCKYSVNRDGKWFQYIFFIINFNKKIGIIHKIKLIYYTYFKLYYSFVNSTFLKSVKYTFPSLSII